MINETDLAEFESAVFTGVTVGIGSQVLIFGNNATVLVQCPFMCEISGQQQLGHGEQPSTCELLFDLLNTYVESASIEGGEILLLKFAGSNSVRIIPVRDGLESYVLTTRLGICPVAVT